jgi:dihydroorotate dehydrogenase
VGGIDSGETALAKIRAGALLVQLYTAFIFHGLRLLSSIKAELSNALAREGCDSIAAMVGTDAAALTAERWPGAESVVECTPKVRHGNNGKQ